MPISTDSCIKVQEKNLTTASFWCIVFSLKRTRSDAHDLDASFYLFFFSQMKELGVIFYNCSCLVLDLQRIFALYSSLKFKSRVPQTWSKRLYGVYDNEKKLQLQLNETKSQAFVSVSFGSFSSSTPPPLLALCQVGMFEGGLMLGSNEFNRSLSVPVLEEFKSVHSYALSYAVPNENDKHKC